MCGTYADAIWASENLECMNIKCHAFGKTLVPWGATYVAPTMQLYGYIATQPYQPKEQDMCNTAKRWGVTIEPSTRNSDGSDTYYVRFQHKDKSTTDEMTRNFDTFEQALDFANKTYKELK